MLVMKQCACGSTDFYNDDNTWRCEKCDRLAEFKNIELGEQNNND